MSYCTYCGASLEGTVNFCKNCGKKLLDAQASLSELAEKSDVPAENTTLSAGLKSMLAVHKKLAIGIGAGVAVIALVLVLVFAVFLNSPEAPLPLTVAELLDLGEKYLLDLDYEQALVHFLAVIKVEPMNLRGYIGAAESHIGLGDVDDAIATLRDGYERFTDSHEFLNQSIAAYESIINAAPKTPDAYINLAEIHIKLGDEGSATYVLRRGLAAMPDNTIYWAVYWSGSSYGTRSIITADNELKTVYEYEYMRDYDDPGHPGDDGIWYFDAFFEWYRDGNGRELGEEEIQIMLTQYSDTPALLEWHPLSHFFDN